MQRQHSRLGRWPSCKGIVDGRHRTRGGDEGGKSAHHGVFSVFWHDSWSAPRPRSAAYLVADQLPDVGHGQAPQKGDSGQRIIECSLGAASLGGTVPSSKLAALPDQSTVDDCSEEVFGVNASAPRVGDFQVQLRVLRGVEFSRLVRFD